MQVKDCGKINTILTMDHGLRINLDEPFAIWKPKGPTSNQLLNQLRQKINTKKIGHAGTLDPLAEGILVVGVGKATKQLTQLVGQEKEYVAEVFLGATSTTDDEEGEKTNYQSLSVNDRLPDIKKIEDTIKQFIGKIKQVPPIYSAVKIKGREAYKYARQGKTIALKPRPVAIKSIKILEYRYPLLKLKIITGQGVYIRSLARDLGERLGVGGYLKNLVRIRVGKFTKDKAIILADRISGQ